MPVIHTNRPDLWLTRFALASLLFVGTSVISGCERDAGSETPAATAETNLIQSDAVLVNERVAAALDESLPAAEISVNSVRPNILIIVADDLGWGDVGYNESEINTPNLDALANEGLQLDRFYTFPFCSLTRAAFMTGRQPLRMNVRGPISAGKPKPPLDEMFISEVFSKEGYQTWMIGKWHLGGERSIRYRPNERGFDSFYGHIGGGVDHYEHTHWKNKKHDWFVGGRRAKVNGYTTSLLTDEAIRKIKQRDQHNPFFLYLSYSAPHEPIQAPPEYVEKYAHIKSDLRRRYAAMVDFMDMSVGRVIALLESEGLTENTLVLFMSDNGGTHSGGASNAPLKGQKGGYYEGGVRVPAIIKWPESIVSGEKSQRMITVLDLFPTLMQAANIDLQPTPLFDGRSMWGRLTSEADASDAIALLIAEDRGALWSGGFKLLMRPASEPELYNILSDPQETHDLSGEYALKLDELSSLFKARVEEYKESRP